ncbi:MAG TPA: acyl-CoA thioesterase [Ignavibacteriales bacterium]|nr:acyl-CoA thioesterase [Ignavibacteriales bacterium]
MYSSFDTEIAVRPDDIDMNNHVHNSKYLDYVLTARYEQMRENYKMPMSDFTALGYGWVVSSAQINYKRAVKLGDKIAVRTQVGGINGAQVTINFSIFFKENEKVASEGIIIYTLVSAVSGRPVRIPEEVITKYSI